MSILKKIVILFLAFTLLPVFFVGTLAFYNAKQSLEDAIFTKLESIADLRAAKIEVFITDRIGDIEAIQTFLRVRENFPILSLYFHEQESDIYKSAKKNLDAHLKPYQEYYGYTDIMLLDTDGAVQYATDKGHVVGELGRPLPPYLQSAFEEGKKGVAISDSYLDAHSDHTALLMMTAPLNDTEGKLVGVIAFEIDMGSIYGLIEDRGGLGETGETLLGKAIEGGALFLSPHRQDADAARKRTVSFADKTAIPMLKAVHGENGAGFSVDYRGKEVIAAWRHVPTLKWGLVTKIDVQEAFAPIESLKQMIAMIAFTAMLVVSVVALSVAKSITDPIRSLHHGTEIIGEGDLDHRVGTDVQDEIGQLSRAFDKMTEQLKERMRERDVAEEGLRTSELWLRSTYNSLEESVLVVTPDREIAYVNIASEKIFGYSGKELTGQSTEALHLDHAHYVEFGRRMNDAFDMGMTANFEFAMKRKNGDLFPSEHTVTLLKDGDGNRMGIVSVIRDITERRRAEVERLRLSAAITQTMDIIIITDARGDILYANPAFEKATGYSLAEVIGKNSRILKSGRHSREFYENLWHTITSGRGWEGHFINRRKSGALYEEKASISPVFDNDGQIVNFVAVKRDITVERRFERAKAFFTDITSHELRTPLTKLHLLKLMTDDLAKERDGDERVGKCKELTDDIFADIDRIVSATSLLLSLQSKTPTPFYPVYINTLLSYKIESARHDAEKEGRHITFHVDLGGLSKNATVMGTQAMLERAVDEVLSNAIKYTSDGGNVRIRGVANGGGVAIEIRDEGQAISEEKLETLFDPYYSTEDVLHHSTGRYKYKGGGIGLGLTITKMIVDFHGGEISIGRNTEKGGTCVTLTFPPVK